MRFYDLFISYKIGLKDIKTPITFTKLPLYRKVFLIIFLAEIIISGILLIFIHDLFIPMVLNFFLLVVFLIIDSQKGNTEKMLKDRYIPYSERRMNMIIDVLKNTILTSKI